MHGGARNPGGRTPATKGLDRDSPLDEYCGVRGPGGFWLARALELILS